MNDLKANWICFISSTIGAVFTLIAIGTLLPPNDFSFFSFILFSILATINLSLSNFFYHQLKLTEMKISKKKR